MSSMHQDTLLKPLKIHLSKKAMPQKMHLSLRLFIWSFWYIWFRLKSFYLSTYLDKTKINFGKLLLTATSEATYFVNAKKHTMLIQHFSQQYRVYWHCCLDSLQSKRGHSACFLSSLFFIVIRTKAGPSLRARLPGRVIVKIDKTMARAIINYHHH